MKTGWKKWISVLLVLVLVFQLLPTTAFADGDEEIAIIETGEEEIGEEEISLVGEEGEIDPYEDTDILNEGRSSFKASDVLWEDTALREEGTKHFHITDGSDISERINNLLSTI